MLCYLFLKWFYEIGTEIQIKKLNKTQGSPTTTEPEHIQCQYSEILRSVVSSVGTVLRTEFVESNLFSVSSGRESNSNTS